MIFKNIYTEKFNLKLLSKTRLTGCYIFGQYLCEASPRGPGAEQVGVWRSLTCDHLGYSRTRRLRVGALVS